MPLLSIIVPVILVLLTPGQAGSCNRVINGVSGACNLYLNQFTFAGAHNAGSGSNGLLKHWSGSYAASCSWRNQDKSFTYMLNWGVRYFDLDVRYIPASKAGGYWKEGIVLCHKSAYGTPLKGALLEIDYFLGRHKNDIVILRIKDYGHADQVKSHLNQEFSVLKNTKLSKYRNPKLEDAINRNERIVMFINGGLGYHPNMHYMRQVETYRYQGSSFGCFKTSEHVNRIKADSHSSLSSYQIQVDWYYSYGKCLRDLAKLCNEGKFDQLKEVNDAVIRAYKRPINLILIDFVGLEDKKKKFSNTVKAINQKNVRLYG